MHIMDGALSQEVIIIGSACAVAGLGWGLYKLGTDQHGLEKIPAAAVLSATFFVASLIHVPIGVSSVHLIMNGLAGLVLGAVAFPALFVGLLLQAVFFGFGGVTVLGINLMNIALPAVLVGMAFRPLILKASPKKAAFLGGVAGALAIALTTLCVALCLLLSGEAFFVAAQLVFVSHIPVMVIEGLVSAAALYLICKVKPELLQTVSHGKTVQTPLNNLGLKS